jgi:hypothetical protein
MIRVGDDVLYKGFIHKVVCTIIVEAEDNTKYLDLVPDGMNSITASVKESEVIKL